MSKTEETKKIIDKEQPSNDDIILNELVEGIPSKESNSENTSNKDKYTCKVCGKTFDSLQGLAGHMRTHNKKKPEPTPAYSTDMDDEGGEGYMDDDEVLIPPKEQLETWFIKELQEVMPKVMGKKHVELFLSFLSKHPEWIWDSFTLTSRLQTLCKGNVKNPEALQLLLEDLYSQLESKKNEMETFWGSIHARIIPPTGGGYPYGHRGTQVNPPVQNQYGMYAPSNLPPNPYDPMYSNRQGNIIPPFPNPDMYGQRPNDPMGFNGGAPMGHPSSNPSEDRMMKMMERMMDRIEKIERKNTREPMVEVPHPSGRGMIRVPSSQAHSYMMNNGQRNNEKEDQMAEVPNPFGGGTLKVPSSMAQMFIMMTMMMAQNKKDDDYTEIPNPNGEGTIKVKSDLVPFIMMSKPQKNEEIPVPNPFGEGVITVPSSHAPIYMMLTSLNKESEKKTNEELVTIEFAGKPLQVPSSQVQNYLTMNAIMDQVDGMQTMMMQVMASNNSEPVKEKMVKIPHGDGFIEVPESEALAHVMILNEKDKRKMMEKQLDEYKRKIDSVENMLNPDAIVKVAEHMGYRQSESPTYNLIDKSRSDLNKITDKVIDVVQFQVMQQNNAPPSPVHSPSPSSRPAIQNNPRAVKVPRYTEAERKNKLKNVQKTVKKAEEKAKLEEEIAQLLNDNEGS
jgi:hypothetical protein